MTSLHTIHEINALSPEEFIRLLGGIYEHSPWVAEGAYGSRPFRNREALESAMRGVVDGCSTDQRIGILRAHPQLSGKEARQGNLTADSAQEQSRLSLNALSGADLQQMLDINQRFMRKFGFPGIVAVRLHDAVDTVIADLERRIESEYADEVEAALGQVHHIARFRLHDLVSQNPVSP